MEARILRNAMFSLLSVLVISDTSIAARPSSQAIQETRKLDYQENEILFSPLTVRDTASGNIPIVNPSTPGTTPIINPTSPLPPTFTGPPTTTTGPPPIITGPPTTTTGPPPIITGPPTTTTGPPPIITGPPTSGGGSWCIASTSASETALQVALDYACGYGGADCSPIQPSGPCYDPNTVRDHASYAFNDYYQKNPVPTSCAFGGAAQITNTDPSHGNCRFASSSSTPTTPPATPTTPTTPTIPMTPPSTTAPINPFPPGGNGIGTEPTGSDYGSEPTGSPNSSGTISANLLLLIITNCLILSVSVADKF